MLKPPTFTATEGICRKKHDRGDRGSIERPGGWAGVLVAACLAWASPATAQMALGTATETTQPGSGPSGTDSPDTATAQAAAATAAAIDALHEQ
jgi:hypothetical protein